SWISLLETFRHTGISRKSPDSRVDRETWPNELALKDFSAPTDLLFGWVLVQSRRARRRAKKNRRSSPSISGKLRALKLKYCTAYTRHLLGLSRAVCLNSCNPKFKSA